MSTALSRAYAVVVNQYHSPRQYSVTVERLGEMIAKNVGIFTDGFAGEAHLVVGVFEQEADAWALAHRLQRTRTTMLALLQTPIAHAPIAPPELDPSDS